MDWKERFEKLLPSHFMNGRAFKKAELKKMEKIISYPTAKLNEEERLSQKMLREQFRKLERSLYPNPLVRLLRNTGKFVATTIKWSVNKIMNQAPSRTKNQVSNTTTKPETSDSEIRTFLKKSMAEPRSAQKKKEKTKVEAPDINNKVSDGRRKRTGVIVPFKPAKTMRKGI